MATTTDIREWLDCADTADVEVEKLRWQAAEALFEANRGDYKQRQKDLADEIGRTQPTVSKYIRCWIAYGPENPGDKPRKPWAEAWRAATGKSGNSSKAPKPGNQGKAQPKPKPDSDSPGNRDAPDLEWLPIAPLFDAAIELLTNDAEWVAELAPEAKVDQLRRWTDDCAHWAEMFRKALDARFAGDDQVMTD